MKKTPKYGTVVQAKKDIIVGTTVIPQNSVGTVVYREEKGDTEVNVDWGFVVAWVDIKDIRKYDQN